MLEDAGIGAGEVRGVVLVGGSTRVPLVRRKVEELFGRPPLADIDPDSLKVLKDGVVEPALADAGPGERLQFERQGYFCVDPDSQPGKPVFNRTVGLRDAWAKIQAKGN